MAGAFKVNRSDAGVIKLFAAGVVESRWEGGMRMGWWEEGRG